MGLVSSDTSVQPRAWTLKGLGAAWFERRLSRIFDAADVRLDGSRPWDVDVRDERFFRAVMMRGSLGLGESYVDGWWRCRDLETLIYRLLRCGLERPNRWRWAERRLALQATLFNQQTRRRARRVAAAHYDLGEDVFAFLGAVKNYSCGYFEGTDDLDVAQQRKLELLCRKLQLRRGDRLLDIGGGWGEFARYAASRYGASVTSINIADEQLRFARSYCAGCDVEVVKCDYRDVTGSYDKIAAIAMLPHVGPRNYRHFMQVMHDRLRPNGIALIESTGGNAPRTHCEPWIDTYIFRGGTIPALSQVTRAYEGLFVLEDLHNFAPSYVATLRAWYVNLQRSWPSLSARHGESLRRMFEYFLLACAAAFRARELQYWHLVLTRPGTAQPRCRN